MKRLCIAIGLGALAAALAGCSHRGQGSGEPLRVERLDSLVYFWHEAPDDVRRNPPASLRTLMGVMGLEASDTAIEAFSASRGVRYFTPEVFGAFGSLDSLERALSSLAEGLGRELPGVAMPAVSAVVWPYTQSIVTADTLAFVALNHYLGAGHQAYSPLEPYQRRGKEASRITYDLLEALLASHYAPSGHTVLEQMLWAGAVAEAQRRIIPGASAASALGYSPQQWKWLTAHEAELWRALAGNNLIYSTDPMDATRLLAPSPATTALSPDAPGRAGRFLGYRIVEAWLRNSPGGGDTGLEHLLSPAFYAGEETLRQAGYNP